MKDLEYYEKHFYSDVIPHSEANLDDLGFRPLFFRKKFKALAKHCAQQDHAHYVIWLRQTLKDEKIDIIDTIQMAALSWSAHNHRFLYRMGGRRAVESWDGETDPAELQPSND